VRRIFAEYLGGRGTGPSPTGSTGTAFRAHPRGGRTRTATGWPTAGRAARSDGSWATRASINEGQAQRAAARAELNAAGPGPSLLSDAEVHAMIASFGVRVPGTPLASCDLLIFVDEAGESVAPAHVSNVASWSLLGRFLVALGAHVEARLAPERGVGGGG
jgi:hypothetical protein